MHSQGLSVVIIICKLIGKPTQYIVNTLLLLDHAILSYPFSFKYFTTTVKNRQVFLLHSSIESPNTQMSKSDQSYFSPRMHDNKKPPEIYVQFQSITRIKSADNIP